MAASTSRRCCMNLAWGVVAFVLLVVAVCASARRTGDAICPIADIAVFPYWSFCDNPAVYSNGGEAYQLADATSRLLLAPEWDETNSTYYVRLADKGATYLLAHRTRELRPYVALSEDVIFINLHSGRVLAWRREGEDEDFLVEVEVELGTLDSAQFKFASNNDVNLPCPLIYPPPQCHAYSILAFHSTAGLTPYYEDGAIYFKKSATDLSPLLLLRASASLHKNTIFSVA